MRRPRRQGRPAGRRWPRRSGATLFANEISEHRAELVRQTLGGAIDAGIEVMVGTGDGREIGEDEPGAYDRVLVDAPCTGLGALRRRPEARWRRTTADLADLGGLQRALLVSAIEATRPGGVVAYATCSPHLNETRFVVGDVVKKRQDVDRPGRPAAVHRRAGRAGRRTSARARSSSCGRTCTAPTRCSWPCCARADGGAVATTYHVPVQISPSILASDFANLETELRRIANADWAHVDVMDDHFVPNLTLGLPVVEALARVSPVPLDCHLMIDDPDRWAPAVRRGRRRPVVTFHVEAAARRPGAGARPARGRGPRRAWRSSPAPPSRPYADLLPDLDMVLVMTVEPGFGGQSFMADQMPKVREVREAVRRHGGEIWVQVDGGVSRRHHRAVRRGRRRRVRGRVGGLRRRATRPPPSTSCAPCAAPAAHGAADPSRRRRRGTRSRRTPHGWLGWPHGGILGATCSGVGVIPNRR